MKKKLFEVKRMLLLDAAMKCNWCKKLIKQNEYAFEVDDAHERICKHCLDDPPFFVIASMKRKHDKRNDKIIKI